ncbi:hypothetical protein TNCV_4428251 [Trichonephila clavipes]|nr:hypothetical protein TNCV_4428251 [Trichonephila clavipes]
MLQTYCPGHHLEENWAAFLCSIFESSLRSNLCGHRNRISTVKSLVHTCTSCCALDNCVEKQFSLTSYLMLSLSCGVSSGHAPSKIPKATFKIIDSFSLILLELVSAPSGIVLSDADYAAVGYRFESWRRHGCL